MESNDLLAGKSTQANTAHQPLQTNQFPSPSHKNNQQSNQPVGGSITINLYPESKDSASMAAFMAEAMSLGKRLEMRKSWSRAEIETLLQWAVNAARAQSDDKEEDKLVVARGILERAKAVYHRDVQIKNRGVYIIGLITGIFAIVVSPLLLLWIIRALSAWLQSEHPDYEFLIHSFQWVVKAAPLTTFAPLFLFAGLGATASAMSRLTSIDLREEDDKKMVIIAAATRPLLAVIFASVTYMIFKDNIITITDGTPKPSIYWIVAFMCGYSERFASDILERIPFAFKSSATPLTSIVASTSSTARSSLAG